MSITIDMPPVMERRSMGSDPIVSPVRPLLMPVLDRVGTPAAARVENAIRSGTLTVDAFRGAFQKTVTPYISVRIETSPPARPSADMPF